MGKCGMLQSTGLQRVGHELATEQIIILLISPCPDFHNFMISLENRYCKKKKRKKIDTVSPSAIQLTQKLFGVF